MANKYYVGEAFIALAAVALGAFYYLRDIGTEITPIGPMLTENGFVELKPPSKFFSPGTWVQIVKENPLHLSIVCGAGDALGNEGATGSLSSDSLTLELKTKLSPEFSVDADTLEAWKASGNLKAVKSVTFSLSNVKLLEIPDNVVMRGFKSRSTDCSDAIKFRLDTKKSVSMIKSALIADVDYLVEFDGNIGAEAEAKAIGDLALNLGTKVSDANKTHLEGKQLVFGIRDDVVLATFGYQLPDTGGTDDDRSILSGKGPIVETTTNEQSRRTFSDRTAFASYDVTPLRQATKNSCWATVYTMMRSWKDKKPWSVAEAIKQLGPSYVDYLVKDRGLPGGSERAFVAQTEMVAEPPASYMLRAFTEMMRASGPLWITTGDGVNSHALLLVGIYGKKYEESRAAYEDAVFEFIDPLTGNYKYLPALDFMTDFEREAGEIVTNGANSLELRWQIIHWRESQT